MDDLARALRADPAVRRRRWLGAAVAIGAGSLLAVAGFAVQEQRHGMCRGVEHRLDGIWDRDRRDALTRAFETTSAPYAAEAAKTVVAALDGYTRGWIDARTDACLATRVRGDQSEELLDLRVQCFDERLIELKERTDLFVNVDATSIERAVESAQRLTPLRACSDAAGLRAAERLPPTPNAHEKLESVRARIAKATALLDLGKNREAAVDVEAAVEGATALGYAPALAEALRSRALLEERLGTYDASAATYRDAIAAAESGHHALLAARAWAEMLHVIGERLGHHDDARALLWAARAKVGGLVATEDLAPTLALLEGTLDWRKGRYASAERLAREAVRGFETANGTTDPSVGKALGTLGIILDASGKAEEAEACHLRSLAIVEKTFGAEHPSTVAALSHLADVRGERGDHRSAVTLYERILAIDVRSLGLHHPTIAKIHNNLGDELVAVGALDEAISHYEQALSIWEQTVGPTHPDIATGLGNLGSAHLAKHDGALALATFRRGLAVRTQALGPSHFLVVGDLLNVAAALDATGALAEARSFQERAVELDGKLPRGERDYEPLPQVRLAEAQLALGMPARGIEGLRRVVAAAPSGGAEDATVARARADLTRATAGGRGDPLRLAEHSAGTALRE